jgi:four helix bundle protein
MPTSFEDVKVLKSIESLADAIYKISARWDAFPRDVVGKQLARAVDSIGANVAESYGRYHFGEKLQFLYYSRGSVFETKYWVNRAASRGLISAETLSQYASQLTEIARQLNAFIFSLKGQRSGEINVSKQMREITPEYLASETSIGDTLFTEADLTWLESNPPTP